MGHYLWEFVRSPGAGGLGALVAAVIGVTVALLQGHKDRQQRDKHAKDERDQRERNEQLTHWWARALWALEWVRSSDTSTRVDGRRILVALAESPWVPKDDPGIDLLQSVAQEDLEHRNAVVEEWEGEGPARE
ncbi:hypothetical protein [Enemella dayhoffiae]|uniref:hypothetical protein n=1 Tax=Enemella dayhoffiae TaxID=2016507 RepID=UPI0011406083|nr:hypothetical protein [Enemella dayhoffiae]